MGLPNPAGLSETVKKMDPNIECCKKDSCTMAVINTLMPNFGVTLIVLLTHKFITNYVKINFYILIIFVTLALAGVVNIKLDLWLFWSNIYALSMFQAMVI